MREHGVEVQLFGVLSRRFGISSAFQPACRVIPIAEGARITDVLAELGIDRAEVSHLFLNGEYSAPTRVLRRGDHLGVFGRDMALLYRQYFQPTDTRA
jgi:hypothetical protein